MKKIKEQLHRFQWPRITQEVKDSVMRQLEKGEISIYDRSGVFERFENRFAEIVGVKYALLFNSGTSGLHAAMVACDFKLGDEVICPAYTFYATVTPIFQTGALPVLCDAKPDGNIDPDKVEQLITNKTKAVVITHMWGLPCDLDRIREICNRNKLKLIEDCSHAHGALYKGQPVGSFGDVGVFSLQGQKNITGGEGGILVTDDKEIYDRSLLFGHYNKRCLQEISKDSEYYDYAITGFGLKLRAHPLAVAIAEEQLSHLNEWHKAKTENAKYFTTLLKDIQGINLPEIVGSKSEPAWYAYVILLEDGLINITVGEFVEVLKKRGVLDADKPSSTCPLNYLKLFQAPEKLFPSYEGKVSYKEGDFPEAEKFHRYSFKLPVDVDLSRGYKTALQHHAEIIREAISEYSA